jgi:hypothetical protein
MAGGQAGKADEAALFSGLSESGPENGDEKPA